VIIEISPFLLEEIVACYPDAQFMHVERDVDTWYRSIDNTGGPLFEACTKFPLRQMRLIDDFVDKFCSLHLTLVDIWTRGKPWNEAREILIGDYIKT
jgi:hypothetical protein